MTDKKATTDDLKTDQVDKPSIAPEAKENTSTSGSSSTEKTMSSEMPTNKKASSSSRSKTVKTTPPSTPKSNTMNKKTPMQKSSSKSGPLALILSLFAIAGIGGHYYFQTQQHQLLANQVLASSKTQQQSAEQQFKQALNQQQNRFAQQVLGNVNQALDDNNEQVATLTQQVKSLSGQVEHLSQNQSSDWLLHEAEYLIRLASRSLWLEKSPTVALNLLSDANQRLKELNDPSLLPVRQMINKDIESLRLLPELATDDVILTLMGLSEQIGQLPIAMPNSEAKEVKVELSEDANDWRANLAKSWHIFMEDFITVRRRTANIEPLLSPVQQQNLRQNLQLKLQLGQWAASQHKQSLFLQSITRTQNWLIEYFDTDTIAVQQFIAQLDTLKTRTVSLTLPNKLDSLTAIRNKMSPKASTKTPEPVETTESKETNIDGAKTEIKADKNLQKSAADEKDNKGETL